MQTHTFGSEEAVMSLVYRDGCASLWISIKSPQHQFLPQLDSNEVQDGEEQVAGPDTTFQ